MQMQIKIGDWVKVDGRGQGPGKVTELAGAFFKADFLVENGVETCSEPVPVTRIESVITDRKEIERLEKEYVGEFSPI